MGRPDDIETVQKPFKKSEKIIMTILGLADSFKTMDRSTQHGATETPFDCQSRIV